jgi:hypothetical protein
MLPVRERNHDLSETITMEDASKLELPYASIVEVRETGSPAAANELLSQGWVLVKTIEKLGVDSRGKEKTSIVYVVGRRKDSGSFRDQSVAPARKSSNNQSKTPMQAAASSDCQCPPIPVRNDVSQSHVNDVPDILSLDIDWRQKKDMNPNFYYAFAYGLDGELDPVVSRAVGAIEQHESGFLEQNGWRFSVSKDGKFLQRSRHSTVRAAPVSR